MVRSLPVGVTLSVALLATGCAPDAPPAPLQLGFDGAVMDAAHPDASFADRMVPSAPDAADGADRAVPDAMPDAIDAGAADAGRLPPMRAGLLHLDLGRHALGEAISFTLPARADGLLIQARGAPDGLYRVIALSGPEGDLIAGGRLRATFNPEVAAALVPNDGSSGLPGGAYTVTLGAAAPEGGALEVEVWAVSGAPRALTVALWLPPATGRAPDEPAITAVARALEGQLMAGFGLDAVEVIPVATADSAPAVLAFDGARGDYGGLGELARAAAAVSGAGPVAGDVDAFLVERIIDGVDGVISFSGGLPGPFAARGTAASVVVAPLALVDDFPEAVADRLVHELGHALGLFHTTEPFGDRSDPLADTPECPLVCDADGDGVLFARECGARASGEPPCQGAADNLMFWALGGLRGVTDAQRIVIGHHPAVAR